MAPTPKSIVKFLLNSFIALFVFSTMAVAQGNGGNDPDFPDVPLDGGLSILLVAGAAFGGKKLYDYKKSSDNHKAEK